MKTKQTLTRTQTSPNRRRRVKHSSLEDFLTPPKLFELEEEKNVVCKRLGMIQ